MFCHFVISNAETEKSVNTPNLLTSMYGNLLWVSWDDVNIYCGTGSVGNNVLLTYPINPSFSLWPHGAVHAVALATTAGNPGLWDFSYDAGMEG